jgi:hypothetical protein
LLAAAGFTVSVKVTEFWYAFAPFGVSPELAESVQVVAPAVVGAVPVIVPFWLAPTVDPEAESVPPAVHETVQPLMAKPANGSPALYVNGMLTEVLPAVALAPLGPVIATAFPEIV